MRKGFKRLLWGAVGIIVPAIVGAVVNDLAPKALPAVWSAVTSAWEQSLAWVLTGHSLPGWSIILLGLLGSLTAVGAVVLVYAALCTATNRVATEDIVDGVLWRWEKPRPSHQMPEPYCPICDAYLIYQLGGYAAAGLELYCEKCRRVVIKTGAYYNTEHIESVAREILRRDRVAQRKTASGVGS